MATASGLISELLKQGRQLSPARHQHEREEKSRHTFKLLRFEFSVAACQVTPT